MKSINKILIVRFSSIGDIVLASPLIRGLRTQFPSAHIDFVVRKEYADLIKYNDNLNNIYEFDTSEGFDGLQNLKNQIRNERYDLIVDIHNSLRSKYLCLFSGAYDTVTINKRVIARTLLVKFKKNIYPNVISVADRYIESVANYGVRNDGNGLEIKIPEDVLSIVNSKIMKLRLTGHENIIGICPSARHETKCWPEEKYTELGIELVKDANTKLILFGSLSDGEKCKAISNKINKLSGSEKAIDLSGKLTLLETAAAMDICDVVISNDTGLMHIAAARKRKVVAIFGPTVKEFGFFPAIKGSIVIEQKGLYCRPCSHIGNDKCPEGHFRCMQEIKVEEVLQSVKRLLALEVKN